MRSSYIILMLLLWMDTAWAQKQGKNVITGTVIVPTAEKIMVKGGGYNKDGTTIMHSDDSLAQANNNLIAIAYPVSFAPVLQPTENAIITQKEQTFIPNVLPITKGSTVYFLNEDQFFHNVYSLTPGAKFNIGRRPPGSPYPIKIEKKGVIKLSCDIHPHMKSYILSLETPYFVRVDKKGNYKIADLPDGIYRVELFHPLYSKIEKTVMLDKNRVLILDFDFTK